MARVIGLAPYTFLPAKTGGQRCVALFSKYFSRYVSLLYLTTADNQNQLAEGYQAIPLFSGSKFRYINPFYYFSIRKIIRSFGATHILIEHPYFGWLALLLKWTVPVQLIIHSHNIESLRFKGQNKWWWGILWHYEKFTHRHADQSFFIQEEDRQYAIGYYGLDPGKCLVVTYGTENKEIPSVEELQAAKKAIREQYGIREDEKLLLFAGAYNYQPNRIALQVIEEEIAPRLQQMKFPFKVIICGPGLESKTSSRQDVVYAGFVADIDLYFKAADVFLNPITEGGGIKTKLVEALSMNANAVSTVQGAIGVDPGLCNGKLRIVENGDWERFVRAVTGCGSLEADIPPEYFQHFYWGHNTRIAAEFINRQRGNRD